MQKNAIQEEMLKIKIRLALKKVHDMWVLKCIYQLICFHIFDFRKKERK